jgi:prevent-host-death family protein
MKRMTVTDFKKHALEVFREVSESGESVVVTRRGQPLAQVNPVEDEAPWIGKLSGALIITGDIVSSVAEDDWDAAN